MYTIVLVLVLKGISCTVSEGLLRFTIFLTAAPAGTGEGPLV